MKLKALLFGAIAAVALVSARPASAIVPLVIDAYEDGTDQLLPFNVVVPGYVVLMEQATNNNYDTSNWSDIAYFFNVPVPLGSTPSPTPGSYVHLYSDDAGPAFADLSSFLPAVQSAGNSFFMVEDPSGVTDYSPSTDRIYRFHEPVSTTPEPATAGSAAFGLAGLGLLALARRRA